MNKDKAKGIIEAMLFSAGRVVTIRELITILELNPKEIAEIISELKKDYKEENRGIEIVAIEDGYQLASKKEYYEYLFPLFDKKSKPKLSVATLETLAIIAYNARATKTDVDMIRGVDSTATIYRLQDYNLIEQAGKSNLPGKPMTYKVSENFYRLFGIRCFDDLPKLPKYKLDENRQIVIDDIINNEQEVLENSSTDESEN